MAGQAVDENALVMKIRKRHGDPDRLYENYRTLRENRAGAPRGDYMASATQELDSVSTGAFGPDDEDAALVNALYREYRFRDCSVNELTQIRERVVANTLAALEEPRQSSVFALWRRARPTATGHWMRPLAASFGAVAVAATLIFSLVRSDVDLAALPQALPVSIPVLDRAGELLAASDIGDEAANPSMSRNANVFALGAGALNLALAIESRNSEHTRATSESMAGVYAAEQLLSLSQRASEIVQISPESASYSRSVVRRSIELLVTTQASFEGDELFLYELGQWVEAVYLSSHAVRAVTHTETLSELLLQAQQRFAAADVAESLDSELADRIQRLASIDPDDGLGSDEIALARTLSAEIKSMVN